MAQVKTTTPTMMIAKLVTFLSSLTVLINSEILLPEITNLTATSIKPYDIELWWNVTDHNDTIDSYTIEAIDQEQSFKATYEGVASIDMKERSAQVHLHQSETVYDICLIAYIRESLIDELDSTATISLCGQFKTIPVILGSSVIALCAVIGYLLLTILCGLMAFWVKSSAYAAHQYKKAESNEGMNGQATCINNKTNHVNHATSNKSIET